MASSLSRDNGTILAIPLLPNGDPTTRDCPAAFYNQENGLVVSSQDHFDAMDTLVYLHSAQCTKCRSCHYRIMRMNMEHYLHAVDFNNCYDDEEGCASWHNICEKNVTGISFQVLKEGMMFAAIFTSFTPTIQNCLAIYPVPSLPDQKHPSLHTYHVIHSSKQEILKGLTIQNPHDSAIQVSINLTGPAISWADGVILQSVEREVSLKCREVMWLQLAFNGSLSGTMLTSSLPLNVFSNSAMLNTNDSHYKPGNSTADFEYNTHLRHQMPERTRWGKRFIIDVRHSELLQDEVKANLMYEVTIISYTPNNTVSVKSKSFEEMKLREPTLAAEHQDEYHLRFSMTEMLQRVYLDISSESPVLVLSEAYSSHGTASEPFHHSILAQPVEWHANKQIIVLAHPLQNVTYRYRISVVVPRGQSDPSDILESESGHYCQVFPVSGYSFKVYSIGSDYDLLVYHRNITNSEHSQSRLLLRHSDGHTDIGVTVHAYSDSLYYAYSNGYTLGTPQHMQLVRYRATC